jgi:hypothetical protein
MIGINLGSIVDRFASRSAVTRIQQSRPLLLKGQIVDGTSTLTTTTITAVVHPATGDEVKSLPQGMRDTETIAVYTKTALTLANVAGGAGADHIVYLGNTYEVAYGEPWFDDARFYKYLCQKVLA